MSKPVPHWVVPTGLQGRKGVGNSLVPEVELLHTWKLMKATCAQGEAEVMLAEGGRVEDMGDSTTSYRKYIRQRRRELQFRRNEVLP